ncbi:MAG: pantetheine-phosphate adenylyltransferase [Candidatus Cloacimonetes bacterium]|nr:pantetheine-phosphate adenylyltransferase [Candidatus Cloacimonadota bacterium]
MKKALYPGTFDPITKGHLEIVRNAVRIFDEVIIAVAEASEKKPLFSIDERVQLCKESLTSFPKVRVAKFTGLAVDFAEDIHTYTMIRGLRAVSDFEYELSLALMNKNLNPKIDTIFLLPDSDYLYLSSSMVKQVIQLGGSLSKFVSPNVEQAVLRKYKTLGEYHEPKKD